MTEEYSFGEPQVRCCLRDPIPEIDAACNNLEQGVAAYLAGDRASAIELIRMADNPAIAEWAFSIMGKNSEWNRSYIDPAAPPKLGRPREGRVASRGLEAQLHERYGHQCCFCGMPLLRRQVRDRLRSLFPDAVRWGNTNDSQHTMIRVMQAQYDHLLPYSRGGETSLDNMVITCHPCNYGKMEHTLAEMRLIDPRERQIVRLPWDGLEQLLGSA